ncbi:MAG: alcohol dehydrogenase catalytic domain-containing protein [Chloroflexi bacterium]|nr:alcohol dehydrogenase catalytic domain-containing protein [Chloroflexota bacterium]
MGTSKGVVAMKACIYLGPGQLRVEERPVPSPGPGEALIKTRAASLCYSDIRVFKGEKAARPGVVQGHEAAGEVVAVGSGVAAVRPGDRVALCPILACGACYFCLRGKRNRCLGRRTLGYDADGGLAEYILAPRELVALGHLLKLPEGLAWDLAAQTEPFACALYSLEACRLGPGASVAIVGAGPMGLTHLLLARGMGCHTIVVCDPVEERLAVAQELGATAAVSPDHFARTVHALTDGLGADGVAVTVGNTDAIQSGLVVARKQGVVNIFGGCPPGTVLALDPNLVHYNELWVTGTQNANPEHYQRALGVLAVMPQAGRLFTHRFGIQEAPRAFEARLSRQGLKAVIDF